MKEEVPDPQSAESSPKATGVRWVVLIFLAFSAGGAYLTRNCISVANTTIQKDLSISDEQMGWVLGISYFGYCIFQVPGGWLGNRFGTRVALSGMNFLWSLLTICSAMVSTFIPLLLSRVAFGLAQGGLVPVTGKIIRDWLPESRRGFSSSVIGASMSAGGAIATALTGYLLTLCDWQIIFYIYSSVGITWAIGFYCYFRNKPEEHKLVNDAELSLIRGDKTREESEASRKPATDSDSHESHPNSNGTSPSLVAQMFRSKSMWGVCLQSTFRAAGYAIFVSWFPAFLEYRFLNLTQQVDDNTNEVAIALADTSAASSAGYLATIPLIAVFFGSLWGGVMIDYLLKRTDSKRISRCGMAVISLAGSGLFILSSSAADSVYIFVATMSVGALFVGMGNPASWAATMDLAGKQTAIALGVMNMAGALGAFSMPIALGYLIGDIKKTGGDWNLVLYAVAATYFAGAVAWLLVNPNQTIDGSDNETSI